MTKKGNAPERSRTADLLITSQTLYQLCAWISLEDVRAEDLTNKPREHRLSGKDSVMVYIALSS